MFDLVSTVATRVSSLPAVGVLLPYCTRDNVIKATVVSGIGAWTIKLVWFAVKRKWKRERILAFQQEQPGIRLKLRRELERKLPGGKSHVKWITELSYGELKSKLQSGELLPSDVVIAYQLAALDATQLTNAATEFILTAVERAEALDKKDKTSLPLYGIPVSVKECFYYPHTQSCAGFSELFDTAPDGKTALFIEFLESLGAVIFVKTNVPQGMMTFSSANSIYGETTNPFNSKRGPGGSTSGEAALLALNASMIGIGTDIGGSLRIPAAMCGLFTLKPTSSRCIGESLCCQDAIERRVCVSDMGAAGFISRDLKALTDFYRHLWSDRAFAVHPKMVPMLYDEDKVESRAPLRIGYYIDDGVTRVHPTVKRAMKEAIAKLAAAGHTMIKWEAFNGPEASRLICKLFCADNAKELTELIWADVKPDPAALLPAAFLLMPNGLRRFCSTLVWPFWGRWPSVVLSEMTGAKNVHEVNVIYRRLDDYRNSALRSFKSLKLDVVLSPGFCCPALALDKPKDVIPITNYTAVYNILNWPAASLPWTTVTSADEAEMASYPETDRTHRIVKASLLSDSVGLPVNLQVASTPYREEACLRLMGELTAIKN